MIRYILVLISIVSIHVANAQSQQHALIVKSNESITAKPKKPMLGTEKALEIWSSTFGTPGEWTVGHDAAACTLDWNIGSTACAGTFPIPTINSTSASDGWAMVDSDLYGASSGGAEVEDSWINTSSPIDLSTFPNAIVEFETHYRRFTFERPYLVVGFGDGSGLNSVVWPDLDPTTDISAMNNVFEVFEGMEDNEITDNPQLVQINISAALAGATLTELQNVYVRLHWTGTWGYAWFVDDFKIMEQPSSDIQLTDIWFRGINNGGVQYGRIPVDQLDNEWKFGGEVFNFGVLDQGNVAFNADFTSFSGSGLDVFLESGATTTFESTYSGALPAGVYTGEYSVVSISETGGPEFGNNEQTRVFEVTSGSQQVYSIDGIGLHPPGEENLAYIGTNSFMINAPTTANGIVLASLYPIRTATQISGLRVMLESGSVVGGQVYASIKDTATFLAGNMVSIESSDAWFISANDLANGYIDVFFDDELSLDTGVYYAAATLFSNDNTADVRVLDDRTLVQPEFASAIYIPGGQVYSNGTAFGIRMLMGSDWGAGVAENDLEGVQIYPNPSEGIVNVTNDFQIQHQITVCDLFGRQVMTSNANATTQLDLSDVQSGMYLVHVSNEKGSKTERILIK